MSDNFLAGILNLWVEIGLYDVILPFIFLYTIVFVVLSNTKILGDNRNVDSIVAFCFGFIGTASLQTVTAMHTLFSTVGFLVIAGLCVMILVGMFGISDVMKKKERFILNLPRYAIISIVAIGLLYVLAISLGLEKTIVAFVPAIPRAVTNMIVAGAVFAIALWYVIGNGSPGDKKTAKESSSGGDSSSSDSDEKSNDSGDSKPGKKNLVERLEPGNEDYIKRF